MDLNGSPPHEATPAAAPASPADLAAIRRYALKVNAVLLAATVAVWGFAWITWSSGQPVAALVLAVFGYAVLRTRPALVRRQAERRFATDPRRAALLAKTDVAALGGCCAVDTRQDTSRQRTDRQEEDRA